MPRVQANGVELEYARGGPADGAPLLLIHGVGAQLTQWPAEYLDQFAAAGFAHVRYDGRDIGRSSHLDAAGMPDLAAAMAARARGEEPDLPYAMRDLADDAAVLLDALGIAPAHVLGVSLGGHVAQQLAVRHPDKVRSLTIMMSYSGNPDARPNEPTVLLKPAPDPRDDEEGYAAASVEMLRALGSPLYPIAEDRLRAFALDAARRCYYPAGTWRQLVAGRTAPDGREGLRRLTMPALVIHGSDDPLVPLACGEDIASNIPGAYLVTIKGLGHDLPPQLADSVARLVALNAGRAD